MSLYLQYRPQSFDDIIGQEHIVQTLTHAVERDQLVHAYLFFGSRGTGKTSAARILAKHILLRGIDDDAVRSGIERALEDGSLVDLIEIDAATNRQIDDVRELKEKVQFTPSVAAAKVYIIDEVHMMTKEAFNALLKTLEEPPEHAYFILATTELHKVPDTIQSRCQRFPFRRITADHIVERLRFIADAEQIVVEDDALQAIARHVDGGMRDAVSLLDQLSSVENITVNDVRQRIGESGEEYVARIWSAIDAGDRHALLQSTQSLQESGVSLEVFLRQLLGSAREQLHADAQASRSTERSVRRIDVLFDALQNLRVSPVPIVALEAALLSMLTNTPDSLSTSSSSSTSSGLSSDSLPDTPSNVSKKDNVAHTVDEASPSVAKESSQPVSLDLHAVQEKWPSIVKEVSPASVRMSLQDASLRSLEGATLTLAFSSAFHRDKVNTDAALLQLGQVLTSQLGVALTVECTMDAMMGASEQSADVNVADAVGEVFG